MRARCEKAVFDQYTVVTTQHGHLGLKGGDSLITPLDDYPAILKGVVQNRIHVRMSTDSDLGGAPVFFSDAQITPCVCTIVVTPLFSNYSELPEVAAYIQSWQFQEAKNPDLALNPLSLDFAEAALEMKPNCGGWFLVKIPSEPECVGAVLLTREDQAGTFRAQIYSTVPVEMTPGLILARQVFLHEPDVQISRDVFKVVGAEWKR